MSFSWFLAIKVGILVAIVGLTTILVKALLSKRKVGTFTSFVIALGAVSILRGVAVAVMLRTF